MNFINQLFSEKGTISSLRVMCMISLLTGVYIGIAGLYSGKPLADVAILAGLFVTAAFTGKIIQKPKETADNGH